MAMNDFMYNPMAVRQQVADPMAVRQQPMPMAAVQSKMGLVADPLAPMPQNAAVYNNANAIGTGIAMYGSPEMRQNSVMMVDQNGDGEVTYGDVIEARINGYKE